MVTIFMSFSQDVTSKRSSNVQGKENHQYFYDESGESESDNDELFFF